ncbi:MAG: cysteine desulfurase NifS [Actinobacteria bacterium HGW-Actinobacteria-7]|jgi:cysteine desulfurase|nr:MAG: cysteine desulfurase NifS [Actinobacteria bacterium HGW-Actinobacteria-7]
MDTRYFDYAATTPVDARVLEAMMPFFSERYGNANSLYGLGRDAFRALEDARERVAAGIGAADPSEIIFTSGGTESDNAALLGILTRVSPNGGAHLIVSGYEHHAVLHPAEWLAKHGYELTVLAPRTDGHIHPDDLRAAMRPTTKLVSIMHGNNEIGTVNDIKVLAEIAHEGGALFHTDAAQTLGKVEFDAVDLGIDAASFSSHKIYGPKGFGALYLKKRTPFETQARGGGQESKRRSGTQNTPGAAGFARALEIMIEEMPVEIPRLAGLRDQLIDGITSSLENTEPSASTGARLPNIAPLLIKGVEGEAMLLQLDNKGIAVSTGSACSSGSLEPSHVLLSIGCPPEIAHGSLRLSLGRFTTDEDVDYFLEVFPPIVERLRAMSPVYARMFGSSAS